MSEATTTPSLPGSPQATPDDPWHGVNFLDPMVRERLRRDPYPLLAHLRELAPVHRTPIGVWRIARHADVLHVLREAPSACGPRGASCRARPRACRTGAPASSC